MAIYTVKTFGDIQDAILEELKIPSTDSTMLTRIKRDVNIMYREIVSRKRWPWLNKFITLTHQKMITTGTITVTQNSRAITFTSAPAISVKGYWFKVDGFEEVYRVAQHTAASTSAVLESNYTNTTASAVNYRLWTDRIPLPSDCKETVEVNHQWMPKPLENLGRQEFRKRAQLWSTYESYPWCYTTQDYIDPNPHDGADIATSVSRSSAGLVKTIVFGSDVSATLPKGTRFQVSGAGNSSYNGEWVVRSASTNTITFTGLVRLQESSTADVSISVKKLSQKTAEESYRELWVYPSQYSEQDVTLHVDYIQEVQDLENDDDEPLIPLDDRIILVYGALSRTWVKQRNPETAGNNERLLETKLARMGAKAGDSADKPNIFTDPLWARRKRRGNRWR